MGNNPNDAEAYFKRGNSKAELGDHQGAIDDYTKAIGFNPKHAKAYNNRASIKAELGDHQGAIDDFTKSIKINPNQAAAYYNRGISRGELGDYEGSIDDCTKAVELCLNNPETYSNGQLSEVYSNRGISKYELGDHQGAIEDYTKSIEIDPNHADVYSSRGVSKGKLGDHQGAIDDFLKLIPFTKENPEKEKGKEKALYQYMPIDSKKLLSLINGEVYFADYQILNDPFECYFMQNEPINECLKEEEITARILSLTHNPESHIMYSHYAKSHKGICVEYEIDLKKLKDNKKVSYGPVQYQTKNKIENLADLYMLKHEQWAYEEEYRIVRFDGEEFMDCKKIKSITFALDCLEGHKKIIYALTSENEGIKYYQIEKKDNSNKVFKKPITKKNIDDDQLRKLMSKHKFNSVYSYFIASKKIKDLEKQIKDQ